MRDADREDQDARSSAGQGRGQKQREETTVCQESQARGKSWQGGRSSRQHVRWAKLPPQSQVSSLICSRQGASSYKHIRAGSGPLPMHSLKDEVY